MESPRKFNDCYFYYYSTCTKGDNCVFRHEPSALGCETMCTAWQQGKCLDKRCKLRHMELRKNRKQIPCYWENQPGGCRKKHCPFMHKNPDARTDGIAPSQPAPAMPAAAAEAVGAEAALPLPLAAPPAPAPAVPLLWQQQRQVVVDSAILGVLPASSDLLGGRRVLAPHPHDAPPNPYAPLHPVDPLVVNFEEESDTESCPPPTPTKARSPAAAVSTARAKSQELVQLERIQAEAAAYYGYDAVSLPAPAAVAHPAAAARTDLDFKVLSLDEIRARKKAEAALAHAKPITLNLSRKRKLSTQEINTTSGKKILKVVRSNSIVYKKLDPNAPPAASKPEQKPEQPETGRKRTLSEQCVDIYDMQDDELVDNVYEFKRIKVAEQTNSKPKLIRNRLSSKTDADKEADSQTKIDNDSDTEVQIVSVDIQGTTLELSDSEVIDVDSANVSEPVDIVDLSDEAGDSDADLEYVKNVPDVVASCQKKSDNTDKELLKDIDAILDDDDDL